MMESMRTLHRILPTIVCALWVMLSRTTVALPDEVASGGKGGAQHLALGEVPKGVAASDWSSIRAAYEAGRHAFQPIESGWQARNPGQQWTTKFDGRGFLAEPRDGAWQWGLELKSYGFGENQHAIDGTPAVKAEGQRLSYQWDATVQEWFVNDQRGLEHGFTISERPDAPLNTQLSTLNFHLAARGTLHPRVSADAQGVLFADASGATVLNYTGLKVWDADGKVLASHFAPAEDGVRLLVEERGARYPLTIDPIAQQAYLKPAAVGTSQAGDGFGTSVAVSGDTVVVGAIGEDSSTTGVNSTPNDGTSTGAGSGAAYVFVRSAGVWTQQAYLKPAAVGTSQGGDEFGVSVSISGDTVVVGAHDEDSSTTGVNSTPNESASQSGAAYVFVRSAGVWTQQAYLKPATVGTTQAGDQFGWSVAVSGGTVVVGAYLEDSSTTGVNSTPSEGASGSGAAYVFVRSAGVWTQQAYLKPDAVGTTQAGDDFGVSVAVSGDTVVVGASQEDSSTTGLNSTPNESSADSGAAYIFTGLGSGVPDADGDGLCDSWELTYWPTRNDHSALDDFDHDGYVELARTRPRPEPHAAERRWPARRHQRGRLPDDDAHQAARRDLRSAKRRHAAARAAGFLQPREHDDPHQQRHHPQGAGQCPHRHSAHALHAHESHGGSVRDCLKSLDSENSPAIHRWV